MKKINVTLLIVVVAAVGALAYTLLGGKSELNKQTTVAVENPTLVTLHKSPTCGCCTVYGSYMKRMGYMVNVHDTLNLGEVKERLGVPRELESCHTSEIDGYVVEGHIPEVAIQKLLSEKPDIKGIGMGGMPVGSPGMPGPKSGSFVIYEITHEGAQGDVFMTL